MYPHSLLLRFLGFVAIANSSPLDRAVHNSSSTKLANVKPRAAPARWNTLPRSIGDRKWSARNVNSSIPTNSSSPVITQDQLDTFKLYSEYSAAAYCSPQQQSPGDKVSCGSAGVCPIVETHDTKIYNAWVENGTAGATGYVAADLTDSKIVLTMRGSVSLNNWITDFKFFQTPCDQYVPNGKCEIGFMNFWESSKPKAYDGISKALTDYPDFDIIVTGHSLGAAAAVYAAIELRKMYTNDRVTLYTYGQPRAGDEVLSQYITDQGNNYRITHTSDAVPKLPPGPDDIPLVPLVSGTYYHLSPEYWISRGLGNDITAYEKLEGLANYDGNAGTGELDFNIIAHIQYYQTNMYYCVLPLPLDLLGGAGTKKRARQVKVL